ncbi:uncharacterized protein N7473_010923 [Penicillium subrubescens]|nr:uncharacterized protein N7473_010923 [Penicillium subrubescens]KAJ5884037.1 hypothetical protein N7473_010923 [Penicillium subrubescens]
MRFYAGPPVNTSTTVLKRRPDLPSADANTPPKRKSRKSQVQGKALGEAVCLFPLGKEPRPVSDDTPVCYFLYEYCVAPRPGIFSGHLDFLERFLKSASLTSCLWPATLASAYLSLSRQYKSQQLNVIARKYYGEALCSVNNILSQNTSLWQNDTLAAIMLLHMFVVTIIGILDIYLLRLTLVL